MTTDIQIGVIGLGFGANHARILRDMPGVCLSAVAETDPIRRSSYEPSETHAYADHASMLAAERLDAVVVAVPAGLHLEVALAVIEAGCAVLVEKPLAPNYVDAASIVDASREADLTLMPGHIERFNPAIVELARRVQAGELGRVLQVSARRMSAMRAGEHGSRLPPTDVNVVHDSAIHDIDAVRYVLGLEVESVFGVMQSGVVTPAEDAINATLRFVSPVQPAPVASLEVNWLSPRRVRDLTVLGEQGMFLADYAAQTLTLHRTPESPPEEIPVAHHDQLEAELRAFVAAARDGTPAPVTPEDGLAAVAIADAITESARTGKTVSLKERAR